MDVIFLDRRRFNPASNISPSGVSPFLSTLFNVHMMFSRCRRSVSSLLPTGYTIPWRLPRISGNISPYFAFKMMLITTLFHIFLILYFYTMPSFGDPAVMPKKGMIASEDFIEILSMSAVQSRKIRSAPTKKKWAMHLQDNSLEPCPLVPPELTGPIKVDITDSSWPLMERKYPWLEKGGHGKPDGCIAQHRVAIIVPYRDRKFQLKVLINHLHEVLKRQQLDYAIFVVEPTANQIFNRAKLMNVGFMEAMKVYPWECFVFSDVDLLPEDDRILYSCPVRPRHMVSAIDIYNYNILYPEYFGGVTALTLDHMRAMNGFSNDYWGWGGEDDDLLLRAQYSGYKIDRYPKSLARYKMHRHNREAENETNNCRHSILNATEARWQTSGLKTLNYKLEKIKYLPLFTHVLVDLFEDEAREDLAQQVKCESKTQN